MDKDNQPCLYDYFVTTVAKMKLVMNIMSFSALKKIRKTLLPHYCTCNPNAYKFQIFFKFMQSCKFRAHVYGRFGRRSSLVEVDFIFSLVKSCLVILKSHSMSPAYFLHECFPLLFKKLNYSITDGSVLQQVE